MIDFRSLEEWKRLWRYYSAGVVNTVFGYSLFSALLFIGLNAYIAQAMAHAAGVAFNFMLYSRYVFRVKGASVIRYIASYAANYLASVALLFVFLRLGAQPYIAGLAVIIIVSAANFLLLKTMVFHARHAIDVED